MGLLCLELCTTIGLPKGPTTWSNIVRDHSTAITGGDLEWEGLAIEVSVALPILTPIDANLNRHALRPNKNIGILAQES